MRLQNKTSTEQDHRLGKADGWGTGATNAMT